MDFKKLHENPAAKLASLGTIHEERAGTFREIYNTYNHLIGPEDCKDDKILLEAINKLLAGVEFMNPVVCLKNGGKAETFRAEGNKNYKGKKFQEALMCYNRSILFAPIDHEVLYHRFKY